MSDYHRYHTNAQSWLRVGILLGVCLFLSGGSCITARSDQPQASAASDLSEMTLQDLMNIEVTSVNRTSEKLSDAAAAIFVITQDDIRRSGLTSIPDLLRMVPGMDVAQINGSNWAVSSRGFNSRFSTKLLVLIDGRSVYTPLYGGVWWDVQDALMEDIDRIEVIRGPGAAMWGANAVNGIINIITKKPRDAQGTITPAMTGTLDKDMVGISSGGRIGQHGAFRVYGKQARQTGFVDSAGDTTGDNWEQVRSGFRCEWDAASSASFTLQGDMYNGTGEQTFVQKLFAAPYTQVERTDYTVGGRNLLGRWSRPSANGSQSDLQVYYDRTERNDLQHGENRDTYDIDFQRHIPGAGRHDVVWGLGYRCSISNAASTNLTQYTDGPETTRLASAFAQDQITLRPDRLTLILGSKFEHNNYTGLEIQPNVRMLWTPPDKGTFWAAASRAIRMPGRLEDSGGATFASVPGPGGIAQIIKFVGTSDFRSEELMAYEVGYRTRPTDSFSLDATAFYNVYSNLRTFETGTPYQDSNPVLHIVVPCYLGNMMKAQANGLELSANWRPGDKWKLAFTYTYLNVRTQLDPASQATLIPEGFDSNNPHNQLCIRSYVDLSKDRQLDTAVYFVEGFRHHDIAGYVRLDARYAWRLRNDMELSIVGQNLLQAHHDEFYGVINEYPEEVPRSFYLKLGRRL
jgi:iron complex outermembrane recepter protein